MQMFRRYFFAGLLVWIPIGITFLVIKFIIDYLDKIVYLLPESYRPHALMGFYVPGLGLLLTFILVLLTGVIATNYIGGRLIDFWDTVLDRIPLVRSVYTSVKQVLHTLFKSDGQSFRRVLLVEYPKEGMWSVAFQTSGGFKQAEQYTQKDLVTVFVPTTPNPTSGFLLFVPVENVCNLNISVDEALKLVISLGVVLPQGQSLTVGDIENGIR